MLRAVLSFLGGATLGAGVVYGLWWRRNFKALNHGITDVIVIDEDVIPGANLSAEEILAFDELVDHTCMGACCVETEDFDSFWDEGSGGGTLTA